MRQNFDWRLIPSFLAALDHGSLLGAARALHASQPTIGRHVEALETALGLTLFDRSLSGLKPTASALRLYGRVKDAQSALAEANILAQGAQQYHGRAPEPDRQ